MALASSGWECVLENYVISKCLLHSLSDGQFNDCITCQLYCMSLWFLLQIRTLQHNAVSFLAYGWMLAGMAYIVEQYSIDGKTICL